MPHHVYLAGETSASLFYFYFFPPVFCSFSSPVRAHERSRVLRDDDDDDLGANARPPRTMDGVRATERENSEFRVAAFEGERENTSRRPDFLCNNPIPKKIKIIRK